ncbi:hypothetical protein WYO_3638 [Methylobacterium sp. GXF4]|uniref:hypothetical protein n=1 Tax=Methylobacterium sp. GXF4 TaxID=1096546 RepID=UPI0002697CC6|nr:hypothetical protein [Methylobacterium sp. GXF4]EIZ83627.1 hypothetical protein WYO_3638 [Methylobacterium sp. GXF4]
MSLSHRPAYMYTKRTAPIIRSVSVTIAVIWLEDGHQWCAADTRLVAGKEDDPVTEIGSKIFSISVSTSAIIPGAGTRAPHYSTEYGFVYAGSALPAVLTAATASTLLSKLGSRGGRTSPPEFERMAELVHRLAKRFIIERRRFDGDGSFSAAFFGWCPHAEDYKVAHIEASEDAGGPRVQIYYPSKPQVDGEPWLVLGGAAATFQATFDAFVSSGSPITSRVPRSVIDKMVAENVDRTVGGSTSVGFAHQHGFELLYTMEPITPGTSDARRTFNGLDLDTEIGEVFPYQVAMFGVA